MADSDTEPGGAAEPDRRCPTCRTNVPEGSASCPACGRVLGEENRCPHCHAIAGVLKRGPVTVCAACGKPRASDVVLGRSARSPGTDEMLTRAAGRGKRAFGVLSVAAGVLSAVTIALLVPGALGLGLAAAGALVGVGVGALSLRSGARTMTNADGVRQSALEGRIRRFAAERGGRLGIEETAAHLDLSPEEADAVLTRMVGDGSEIDVDVDDEGELKFVFKSLRRAATRVRVELDEDAPETEELEAEADAEPERAKREA